MVIAIDGPAASGKGTLAQRLARHYGLPHLDTGLLYRGVALTLLDAGASLDDEAAAARAAASLDRRPPRRPSPARPGDGRGGLAHLGRAGRPRGAADLAAAVSPERARGRVLDGRDIGTVVCPDARVKLFITAEAAERARRRHRELEGRGETTTLAAILADIEARDARDAARATAPLRAAADAVLLDTTHLDADAAFAAARAVVDRAGNP